jgi:hypothetical protein
MKMPETKVILFREITPAQAIDEGQYVLIVGDPAYTDFFEVYGPFDSYGSASSWLDVINGYAMVKELSDPNSLRSKKESN